MESLIEKEESNWTSKKELAEICKCSTRVLEQIVADLSCEIDFASQIHIKKGGYHNSEVFYDDYLVKLIKAKLKKNGLSQGKQIELDDNQIWKIWKLLVWLLILLRLLKA